MEWLEQRDELEWRPGDELCGKRRKGRGAAGRGGDPDGFTQRWDLGSKWGWREEKEEGKEEMEAKKEMEEMEENEEEEEGGAG